MHRCRGDLERNSIIDAWSALGTDGRNEIVTLALAGRRYGDVHQLLAPEWLDERHLAARATILRPLERNVVWPNAKNDGTLACRDRFGNP